jgi:hypothetical protein
MVPTRVHGQDMEKLRAVMDYHSSMGGVDLSDACLTSYHSTRKRLRNYYQKHFRHLIDYLSFEFIFTSPKKRGSIYRVKFPVELIENLI